jgi:TonB family protein
MESQANSVAEAESQSSTASARRLVIRIKLDSKEPLQAPVRRRVSRGALLLMLGAVAGLLSWAGVSMLRTDSTSAPAAPEWAPNSRAASLTPVPARSDSARVVSDERLPQSAAETTETGSAGVAPKSTEANPLESEVRDSPDAPPSPINEALPDVPQSALDTIRGTVRVSVRVNIDKEGAVVAAIADDPGPSRYFERLAVEASKKWTFTPADSQAQRIMLVRFHFTRAGATARVNSLQ